MIAGDQRCIKCGLTVDPRGVNPDRGPARYCRCVCTWPGLGCRQPTYFVLNANQNVQPFDYDGTPHHATCRALKAEKQRARQEARPVGVPPLERFFK